MGRDEISLLKEEFVHLFVKSLLVVPSDKPTLLCLVWTRKSYNPDSFRVQLKSIWKARKNFEIQVVGQNLFMISFENEDDLEMIMEGRPWLFRKQLIIFDRLVNLVERNQIRLVLSLFWLKISPCQQKCDKNDLMHAIGSNFGGVIRSKIKGDFFRLRAQLDVQKPLRRVFFVSVGNQGNLWISFKDENLANFFFRCGRMGHEVKECTKLKLEEKDKLEDEFQYLLALKAELNLIRRESLKFGSFIKKAMQQCSYIGGTEVRKGLIND